MYILLYLADLKDYPMKKAKERAIMYLKRFDLEGKENVSVEELSKGMGQEVQFISSILHEPDLLILDEPFSGLDPVSQELFKSEIRQLADEGTAILLSSHQMNLVEEMCDRLFLMHQGKRVIYGFMDDVKSEYANFKCTIRGINSRIELEKLPFVEKLDIVVDFAILHLSKDVQFSKCMNMITEDFVIARY